MLLRQYIGSFRKTQGNTRLYLNRVIPPKTLALILRGVTLNNNDLLIEYVNNKNINAVTVSDRQTFYKQFNEQNALVISFAIEKKSQVYTFARSFAYDIQFTTSQSADIDVFALIDEDAQDLQYLPITIREEYPLSSSVFAKYLKGELERKIILVSQNPQNAASGVFEVRSEKSKKEIYKELIAESEISLTSSDTRYNVDDTIKVTITNIQNAIAVKILTLMPLIIENIAPVPREFCPHQPERPKLDIPPHDITY